jgi:hypothetical protein
MSKSQNLINTILSAGTTTSPWNDEQYKPECKATIKLIVALLVSKLEGIQGFNYERLYAHFIRPFSCEDEIQEIIRIFFLGELSSFTIDGLIQDILLESARTIGKDEFVACLDDLRSLGHIEDLEGRIYTTAFAQYVNEFFFINEDNHHEFIEKLYPEFDESTTQYFSPDEIDSWNQGRI